MVNDWFFPVIEMNVFTTRDTGERLPFDFEGIDLVNFGSSNASGTVTTMAVGARFIFNDNIMFGVAYEAPVSNRKDIMDHRFYFDMVWHF